MGIPIADLESNGKTWSPDTIGQEIEGDAINAEMVQGKNIAGDELATWPDGKPKMTLVLTLQTDLREDDEDTGIRSFWANGGNFTAAEGKGTSRLTALVEAGKKAGIKEIGLPGQHWLIRHTGMGAKEKGKNAPRLFQAKCTVKASSVDLDDL